MEGIVMLRVVAILAAVVLDIGAAGCADSRDQSWK
jgi:hypothetical protein